MENEQIEVVQIDTYKLADETLKMVEELLKRIETTLDEEQQKAVKDIVLGLNLNDDYVTKTIALSLSTFIFNELIKGE